MQEGRLCFSRVFLCKITCSLVFKGHCQKDTLFHFFHRSLYSKKFVWMLNVMHAFNISSWVQHLGGFVHLFILCFAEFHEHCCVTGWVYPPCSNELIVNACFPFDLACILILLLQDVKLDLALLMEWKEDVRGGGSMSDGSGGEGGDSREWLRHHLCNPQPPWINLCQFIPLFWNEQKLTPLGLGTSHGWAEPGWAQGQLGQGCGGWRPALLWHQWGRSWWTQGLTWTPGALV